MVLSGVVLGRRGQIFLPFCDQPTQSIKHLPSSILDQLRSNQDIKTTLSLSFFFDKNFFLQSLGNQMKFNVVNLY